jgi:hypothetical protein
MKVEIQKIKCLRCGYEWYPRSADVRRCPKCKSFYWDREKKKKTPCFYPSQKRRTCSKECYKKLISVLVSGDYNPNYKNGKFYITNNCEICNKDIDPRSKRCAQCKKHGNRYNTKQGYVLVRDRKHPNKNHNNDVCEHIMIMASAIKRPIIKGEIVHHINFIRNDNTITNLHLYESISAHSKCIKGIFKLVKPLLDLKIIEFREGEYFMYSTTERGGALIGGEPA